MDALGVPLEDTGVITPSDGRLAGT
jgi:hypothetical protein